jgi:energy-converting hydrogenase A subunit G
VLYSAGLLAAFTAVGVAFLSLAREKDDLHRLLLTDLAEVLCLVIIALVATDLAEALILPGLVVGISELMALSEIYIVKEGLTAVQPRPFRIEIMDSAPALLGGALVVYGIILSGFSGGAVAGLGVIFWFLCKGGSERFALIEAVSGYSWAFWIGAFFIFMVLPDRWFLGVMLAGSAILLKVSAKMSLIGTMRGGVRE